MTEVSSRGGFPLAITIPVSTFTLIRNPKRSYFITRFLIRRRNYDLPFLFKIIHNTTRYLIIKFAEKIIKQRQGYFTESIGKIITKSDFHGCEIASLLPLRSVFTDITVIKKQLQVVPMWPCKSLFPVIFLLSQITVFVNDMTNNRIIINILIKITIRVMIRYFRVHITRNQRKHSLESIKK